MNQRSLTSFSAMLLASSITGSLVAQQDVDHEQQKHTHSSQIAQAQRPQPAGLFVFQKDDVDAVQALFNPLANQQEAAAFERQPGIAEATMVELDRSTLESDLMTLEIGGAPANLLRIESRSLGNEVARQLWQALVGRAQDSASLQIDPANGLSGTIVIGQRNWELIACNPSQSALVTYAPRKGATGSKQLETTAERPHTESKIEQTELVQSRFPGLFAPVRSADRELLKSVLKSRKNVEQIQLLERTPVSLTVETRGLSMSLPGAGNVLLRRVEALAEDATGAFVWNAAVFADARDRATLVLSDVGCSGTIELNRDSFEIRALGRERHAILKIDTTAFPPDESEGNTEAGKDPEFN